jgi:hypothetical protein
MKMSDIFLLETAGKKLPRKEIVAVSSTFICESPIEKPAKT